MVGADIFWTLTTGTLYNITFKLLFLSSSSYTLYLMLNDYKPTNDPNIDTFRVRYLFSGSAILAILFPYKYAITEVGDISPSHTSQIHQKLTLGFWSIDSVGIFDLVGVGSDPTSAVHAATDGRGRNHHHALSLRAGPLSCAIHSELAVSILFRGICRSHPLDRRHHSDDPLFRLFLDILYQVRRFPSFYLLVVVSSIRVSLRLICIFVSVMVFPFHDF